MQRTTLTLLFLHLVGQGYAAQGCARFSSALDCLANDDADANGTPFCSSYLNIPVRTVTSTSTVAPPAFTKTVTTTTIPETITRTRTVRRSTTVFTSTSVVTDTSTEYETSTTTVSSSSDLACASTGGTITSTLISPETAQVNKRQTDAEPTPSCLTKKGPATISNICKCLSIEPSTTTVITTKSVTKTPTVTEKVTATATAKSTTVVTKTITVNAVATSTETATTTETSVVTATIVQQNPVFSGLAFYASTNQYDFGSATPGESVESVMNADTFATGALANINDVNTYMYGGNQCQLPAGEGPYYDCSQLSLAMNGFFYAAEEGTYTFYEDANTVDNYLALFTGDIAYSSYNDTNGDFYAIRAGGGPFQGGTSTLTLAQGEYVPVTFVYFNGGGPGNIGLQVTVPDGTTYTDTSNFFIFPCDNSPFVPSGASASK